MPPSIITEINHRKRAKGTTSQRAVRVKKERGAMMVGSASGMGANNAKSAAKLGKGLKDTGPRKHAASAPRSCSSALLVSGIGKAPPIKSAGTSTSSAAPPNNTRIPKRPQKRPRPMALSAPRKAEAYSDPLEYFYEQMIDWNLKVASLLLVFLFCCFPVTPACAVRFSPDAR